MESHLTRRAFVAATVALGGCGQKARGFRGYAFVANQEGRSIAAVDLSEFRLARQIALDSRPSEVIAPGGPRVYALAPESGTIYEIDAGPLAVKRRARLAQRAVSMRLAGDAKSLWLLAREPRELMRVPLDSLHPAERIRLAHDPGNFELGRRQEQQPFAAVGFPAEGAVALYDLTGKSAGATVDVGGEARVGGFRKDGRHVLVGNGAERLITIVDVAGAKIVVRLPLPLEPENFCFLQDGGQLFVTGPGRDAVVIVEPFGTQVGETMLAGNAPGSMAAYVTAQNSYLFVCNPGSGDVTILDIDTRKLVVVVHVGVEPRQVVFTPDSQYALVLNSGSGDMAVIRIRQFTSGPQAEWAQKDKRAGVFLMVPVGARPVGAAVVGV